MRLLFYIHSLSGGGAERVVASLANYWAAASWDVTVATLTGPDRDAYTLDARVQRIVINLSGGSRVPMAGVLDNLRRVRCLRRLLKEFRPDVAVSMMNTANVILALAGLGIQGTAVIGSERVYPPMAPLGRVWSALRWWCYRYMAAVAAQCQQNADWLNRFTCARRVAVIPNPVKFPLPASLPVIPPRSVGVVGRRRILAVGRLERQKGFDLLIDAFARVSQRVSGWDLVVLGDGPLKSDLLDRIARQGLSGSAWLPGHVGNLDQWYDSADMFVLSSRFEGFPNVLLEAMAKGLPVISFDCDTGPRDIIRHAEDGLLVPGGDVEALCSAIETLMGDDRLRQQLARRAVEVRERYGLQRIAGMWEALFCEVRA